MSRRCSHTEKTICNQKKGRIRSNRKTAETGRRRSRSARSFGGKHTASCKVANIVDVYSLFSDGVTALAAEEAITQSTINSI